MGAAAYSGAQQISDPKQKQIWLDHAGLYFSEAVLRYLVALGIPPFEGVADQVKPTGDLILPWLLAAKEKYKDDKAGAEAQPAPGAATAGGAQAGGATGAPNVPQKPCPTKADCDKLCAEAERAEMEARAAKDAVQAAETQQQKDLAKADQLEREAYQQQFNKDNRTSEKLEIAYAKRAQAKALRDNSAAAVAKAKAEAEANAKAAAAARAACEACRPCLDNTRTAMKTGTDAKPKQPEKKPGDTTGGQTPQEGKAVGAGSNAGTGAKSTQTPSGSVRGYDALERWIFEWASAGPNPLYWPDYVPLEFTKTKTEKGYDTIPDDKKAKTEDEPNKQVSIGGGPGTTWQLPGPTPCSPAATTTPSGAPAAPTGSWDVCVNPLGELKVVANYALGDRKSFVSSEIGKTQYDLNGHPIYLAQYRYVFDGGSRISTTVNETKDFPSVKAPGTNVGTTGVGAGNTTGKAVSPKKPIPDYDNPEEVWRAKAEEELVTGYPPEEEDENATSAFMPGSTMGATPNDCKTADCLNVRDFCKSSPSMCTGNGSDDSPYQLMITVVFLILKPHAQLAPRDGHARFVSVAYHVPPERILPLPPETLLWEAPAAASDSKNMEVSFVSTGNTSGEAFQLQVRDPSGKTKRVALPEGVVLEPTKPGSAKPAAARGTTGLITQQLAGFCLQFLKLPPELGMVYRIAGPALQEKFQPMRMVLQAGRMLAEKGKLHPDSDPGAYADSIRQYALWAMQEGWNEKQFGDNFVERTKKNAEARKVQWSPKIESALRGAIPGRWRDVTQVLDLARGWMKAKPMPKSPVRPAD